MRWVMRETWFEDYMALLRVKVEERRRSENTVGWDALRNERTSYEVLPLCLS